MLMRPIAAGVRAHFYALSSSAGAGASIGTDCGCRQQASKPPAYDVVSIKAHDPWDTSASTQALPNGFRYINMPLSNLVSNAYVYAPGTKFSGLPEWADRDR